MAVDMTDLVPSLTAAVNPPGADLFPNATEDDWLELLRNGFWSAKLRGAFPGYRETDGFIVEDTATPVRDMPRVEQQLIVLSAALSVVRSALRNTSTLFRAKAGPVEFETQQSATTMRELLVQLSDEFKAALVDAKLLLQGTSTTVAYYDAVYSREAGYAQGSTEWWN
jgi:hypothetical protein